MVDSGRNSDANIKEAPLPRSRVAICDRLASYSCSYPYLAVATAITFSLRKYFDVAASLIKAKRMFTDAGQWALGWDASDPVFTVF